MGDDGTNIDQDNSSCRVYDGTLAEAAFAIFSLYILHETNPLPRGGNLKGVDLLSTGLRNRENSKMFYRRHFRPWIRTDTTTFATLCYWRERARALSSTEDNDVPRNNSIDHLIAQDVLTVLENLWDQLDFVSYTGPRGLEAMAGHPDYPYQATDTNNTQKESPMVDTGTARQEQKNDETKGTNVHDEKEDLGDLQRHVQKYLESRKSIRIPLPVNDQHRRRVERLRQALDPIFNVTSGTSIESILSKIQDSKSATTVLQSKPRMVTFSVIEPANTSRPDDVTKTSGGESVDPESTGSKEPRDDNAQISYELVLPLGTPAPMKKSLESAIEELLNRDSMALLGSLLPTVSVPTDGRQLDEDDGVSTLAAPSALDTDKSALGGETIDSDNEPFGNDGSNSIQTGAGRKALMSLLTKAKSKSAVQRRRASAAASSSAASLRSNAGQEALKALLEHVHGASGSSVASDTGQKAIQNLFDQVQDTSSVASLRSSAGQEALQALLDQVQHVAGSSGDSIGSAAGQKALQSLLGQVQDKPMDHRRSFPTKETGLGPSVSEALLAKAEPASHIARRPRYSQSRRGVGFLTDQIDVADTLTDPAEGNDLSDVSGGEEDDFSVAMSSMGRRAIKELLDSAEANKPQVSKISGKSNKKRVKDPGDKPVRRVRRRTTKNTSPSARRGDQSQRPGADDERSTLGNDALKHLLSQAQDSTRKK